MFQFSNIQEIILGLTTLVNMVIPLIAGVALLVFLWGLSKTVLHADSEDARVEGRRLMFWGIVGLFVMISIWGLIEFMGMAFGIGQGGIMSDFFIGSSWW